MFYVYYNHLCPLHQYPEWNAILTSLTRKFDILSYSVSIGHFIQIISLIHKLRQCLKRLSCLILTKTFIIHTSNYSEVLAELDKLYGGLYRNSYFVSFFETSYSTASIFQFYRSFWKGSISHSDDRWQHYSLIPLISLRTFWKSQ